MLYFDLDEELDRYLLFLFFDLYLPAFRYHFVCLRNPGYLIMRLYYLTKITFLKFKFNAKMRADSRSWFRYTL